MKPNKIDFIKMHRFSMPVLPLYALRDKLLAKLFLKIKFCILLFLIILQNKTNFTY